MHRWTSQTLPAITLLTMLAGCQTGPAEGEYVTFVRELMTESAHLDEQSGEGPDRSDEAERAVREWRAEEGED